MSMTRRKWQIPASQKSSLRRQLESLAPNTAGREQSCDYRLNFASPKIIVKQYTNGTLYVEGIASPLYDKIAALAENGGKEKVIASQAGKVAVSSAPLQLAFPCIGQDESGKGDYFGAPVVTSVCLTLAQSAVLEKLGVQDSKNLSAVQITKLAIAIREVLPETAIATTTWTPKEYNTHYEQFKAKKLTLNNLLGWAHAKVLDEVLAANENAKCIIIDQFATTDPISGFLAAKPPVPLSQTPKAERFIAVAAASILARDTFVRQIKSLEAQYNVRIPLGASNEVIHAAKRAIQAHGEDILPQLAKLHFKTTEAVLRR